MSESIPYSNEHLQPWPSEDFVDIRQSDEWEDFVLEMYLAEEAMAAYTDLADEHTWDMVAHRSIDLGEKLGWQYSGQPSRVLGSAYYNEDMDAVVPIDSHRMSFHGCELKYIKNRWQAAFEFYADGSEEHLPEGYYYVPVDPTHIMDLRIRADYGYDEDELTPVQALHEAGEAAQAQVFDKDFINLPAQVQGEILRNICIDVKADSDAMIGEGETIVKCGTYYTSYEDMPFFDLRDNKTDRSLEENADLQYPQGVINSANYPELDFIADDQVITPWDFTIGAGAPCLELHHADTGRTFYIPLLSIEDIL